MNADPAATTIAPSGSAASGAGIGWTRLRPPSRRSRCKTVSIALAERRGSPFAAAQRARNRSAASRLQWKQGRWPAASATASSRKNSSVQLRPDMTARRRPLYSQLQTSQAFVVQRLFNRVLVAGSWMMPRFPVNVPRWEMATISPKGVTRFCRCKAVHHGRPVARAARRSPLSASFAVEQSTLALDTPGISRKRTVIADHAMAGNGDGEIVRGASAGDGAHRLRRSDSPRDLGIGNRLADGNLLSACHTRCWKAVPRTSSGRSRPIPGVSTKPTTCATRAS